MFLLSDFVRTEAVISKNNGTIISYDPGIIPVIAQFKLKSRIKVFRNHSYTENQNSEWN